MNMANLLSIATILSELFLLSVVGLVLLYVWFKYKYTYWTRRGVPGPKPTFPFGNVREVLKGKEQFFEPYIKYYKQYKHLPYIGLYTLNLPVLSIHDIDLAKQILVKDFDYFQSHKMSSASKGNPLGGHLFNIHGPTWKSLRLKLSPSFTSGKLKSMFPLVEKVARDALEEANKMHANNAAINFTKFYEKYTMDIIGSMGFGLECNSFKSENTEFYRSVGQFFVPQSLYWTIIRAFSFFAPDTFNKLNINRINPAIDDFFFKLVKETVDYREQNDYKRPDFLQALIELRKKESMQTDLSIDSPPFSMTDVAANAMLYMLAGYETSATTGQFAAYHLALDPEIQNKAREEVRRVLAKYEGQCTYEAQNEMTYLNMVLDETMRIHPPLRALFRRCTKDYKIPDSDVVIEKDTLVFIPINAIQMDPDIFENPEKFDPERFTPEKKSKMHPCHWMPFGEGPRKCLGLRQGYIESKMALVKILEKYEILLDDRTQSPLEMKPAAISHSVENGIWIKLRKLEY